ncbi:pimeloyl-ACP methyl ester carboxylesterase [Chitinophaga dinghuensis]|uniref:Pimeloyl-ACP methyl ester carboxylesterase n=1 Tax=Chitinophaga dinghuensis TaxID=1539050 RepID=A0A327VJV2_9BACT|nr:alpha/beta hydrolase [Chitinophaga dinghuensis]RAJ74994.1 pimeloyl-ACP methyl ester carboxylesterase [Chitinophaga dinghuensis]
MKKIFALVLILLMGALFLNVFAQDKQPSFSVKTSGKGKQAILFIPGFTCSGDVWNETTTHLGNKYTSHVFTMAGYAGSPAQAAPNLDVWIEDIVAYVRKNKLDHPVIIGHSLGGGLAMALASRYPDLFGKIIVVDALPCLGSLWNPSFKSEAQPDCSAMESQIMPLTDSQLYKMQKRTAVQLCADTLAQKSIVKWGATTDKKTYADTYCQFANMDQRESIGQIKIPALVLLEARFVNFKPAIEDQYKQMKTATLKFADKGLHFIMYDDKEWYLNQIDQFLQ